MSAVGYRLRIDDVVGGQGVGRCLRGGARRGRDGMMAGAEARVRVQARRTLIGLLSRRQ